MDERVLLDMSDEDLKILNRQIVVILRARRNINARAKVAGIEAGTIWYTVTKGGRVMKLKVIKCKISKVTAVEIDALGKEGMRYLVPAGILFSTAKEAQTHYTGMK